MASVSRRVLLAGGLSSAALSGAAVAGALAGVLPGRARLRSTLGIGQVQAGVPDSGAPEPTYTTFTSAARGREVTYGWAVPPENEPGGLPIVLVLHGRGDDAHSAFESLAVHQFLADRVGRGATPFAVASVDGHESYWHPRAGGDDPLKMLEDELLPRLREIGFSTDRIGVMGYSMGGFGALLLARESSQGRFGAPGQLVAAAASSPALFAGASKTSAGSFDDVADFERWGALSREPGVAGVPLSVSCGSDDPFYAETERYRAACDQVPDGSMGDGAHNAGYWRSLVPAQLDFLGGHLGRRS